MSVAVEGKVISERSPVQPPAVYSATASVYDTSTVHDCSDNNHANAGREDRSIGGNIQANGELCSAVPDVVLPFTTENGKDDPQTTHTHPDDGS